MGTIADYSISAQNGKRHRIVEIRAAWVRDPRDPRPVNQ
jgi:hypothetical protein